LIVLYIEAAAIVLIDHVPAATAAEDELIVGLDSLSIRSGEVTEEEDGTATLPNQCDTMTTAALVATAAFIATAVFVATVATVSTLPTRT
jgi:hypothetical protein